MKTLALALVVGSMFTDPAAALISSMEAEIGPADESPPLPLISQTPPRKEIAPAPAPSKPTLSPNPLWTIPLVVLNETRERPLFSPSRRPTPANHVVPVVQTAPAPVPIDEPRRPQLTLLGTIVNEADGFGIFVDLATRAPFQLRLGASHQGWTLSSVSAGSVILEKGGESAVFVVSKSGPPRGAVMPVPIEPAATGSISLPPTTATVSSQESEANRRPVRRSMRVFRADD